MQDIWLTGAATDALVGLFREMIGALNYLDFLAMVTFEISIKNIAECVFYHLILLLGCHSRFRFHVRYGLMQLTTNL